MRPLSLNREISEESMSDKMITYGELTGGKKTNGKKLLGAMSAEKILVYVPVLSWYLKHGLEIKAVYRTIDYEAQKIFKGFAEQVTAARRTDDTDESNAIFTDMFKLLGNSACGKTENLEHQSDIEYTKDERKVDKALRGARFDPAGYEESEIPMNCISEERKLV